MRESEAAELLIKCAAFDQRTIGEADALAWAEVLDDLRLPDALAAVSAHYVASRDRITVFDVRAGVKGIREARLAEAPEPIPPHELVDDPDAYRAWMRQARSRIADGDELVQPALGHRVLPDLTRVFKSVPRPRYSS